MRKNIDPKEAQKAAMADLRAAVSIASSSRLFGKAEEKIVLASASFCTRKIKEIQVPLDQVYMLYAGDTIADTFIKAHLDMHTRFPVYEKLEDPQSIIGYLNFKDIFSATKTAAQGVTPTTRSILRPILRLDEDTIISAALEKMMKDHQHICLVTDDDKITGILTLEDIFEELVGEIEDEYDFFQAYIRPFGDALIVSATALMANVFKELGLPAPADLPPNITAEKWAEQQARSSVGIQRGHYRLRAAHGRAKIPPPQADGSIGQQIINHKKRGPMGPFPFITYFVFLTPSPVRRHFQNGRRQNPAAAPRPHWPGNRL